MEGARHAACEETEAVWVWFCQLMCLFIQVVNLFNMFITYGDTFLPTSNSYDELYYEIVRMHQVFDNLYCMGMLIETAVCNLIRWNYFSELSMWKQ